MRFLVMAMLLCGPAWAQAVLDPAALPYPGEAVRKAYADFLLFNLPRVFVVSADGRGFIWGNGGTLEHARERAMARCVAKGGRKCAIYAENLSVVWPGRTAETPTAVPTAPLLAGRGWEFVADERYFWHGPAAAAGVYVFSHGHGLHDEDERGQQPHPYVRAFNNAGFDVVRFDREALYDDAERSARWLREGLPVIRRQGYRKVIMGGQSHGAWITLMALDTPGLADAAIAVSAATYGINAGRQASLGQADLYRMFQAARAVGTRVAMVQLADDAFERNPDKRMATAEQVLKPHVAALLEINQPEGINGHGGGRGAAFALRYAGCLYRFAVEGAVGCGK